MVDLLERLYAATEGSRELSDEVLLALGWRRKEGPYSQPAMWWKPPFEPSTWRERRPNCTESVDDALSLVPEGWHWTAGNSRTWSGDVQSRASIFRPDIHGYIRADAPTPALALCIALIKAHEAKES